ncbi:hypothetical protein GCM10028791_17490 [Echinicola sediminis]
MAFMAGTVSAQEKLFAILEFIKVDAGHEQSYRDTENFWDKVHQERLKNGNIMGWDLWSLQPGGKEQGYQYMEVTVFDDLAKMLQTAAGISAASKAAFSDYSEEQLQAKWKQAAASRNVSVRLYMEVIKKTSSDLAMQPGVVAGISLMKAKPTMSAQYEKAEKEVFYPVHQKMVDQGHMEYWGLGRVMIPFGEEIAASHVIVTMFRNYQQFVESLPVNAWEGVDEASIKKANEGREARTLKWGYLGDLIKTLR